MPRPDPRRPRDGQEPLFPSPTTKDDMRLDTGRHQLAFADALHRAYDDGTMTETDGALASTLLAAAWSMDAFEAQNKPYGSTKLLSQVVEALHEAHMTPESRGTDTDDRIAALVDELARAEDVDA